MTEHGGSLDEVGGHCPRCGAEYRPGFTTCADCGVELVPGPAPAAAAEAPAEEVERDWWDRPAAQEPDDDPITEPVAIAEFGFIEEAMLLAGRLRADGIPATVYPPEMSGYLRSYGLQRSYVVLVPKELAEQARESARPFLEGTEDPGR